MNHVKWNPVKWGLPVVSKTQSEIFEVILQSLRHTCCIIKVFFKKISSLWIPLEETVSLWQVWQFIIHDFKFCLLFNNILFSCMLSRLKQQIIEVSNTTSSAHNHDSIKDLTVLDSPMVNNSSSSSSSRPLEQHPSRHHNNKSGSSRRSASSIRPEAPRTPTVSQKNFQEVQFIETLIF